MKILLLIDLQNDFMPGGALAVSGGNEVVPVANSLIDSKYFDLVIASQDYHPSNHKSFASNNGVDPFTMGELNGAPQVMWPDHCVQGSSGAEFNSDLKYITNVIRKGTNPEVDSYSAFLDNDGVSQTGLKSFIDKFEGDHELYIMGLATDYCVLYTAMDAIFLGFNTYLIVDGCRAVNMSQGDGDLAIEKMKKSGAKITTSKEILGV